MGAIADDFASAFRNYETDGLPASGPHKVTKAEARALGVKIEAALAALQLAGAVEYRYETKAQMDAFTGAADGDLALVFNDSTDANNGYYYWVDADSEWVVSPFLDAGAAIEEARLAALDDIEAARVAAEASVAGVATGMIESASRFSLWPDPWFRYSGGEPLAQAGSRYLYGRNSGFTNRAWDATYKHAYGTGAWVYNSASTALFGIDTFWDMPGADEALVQTGDVISIGALVVAASGKVGFATRFFTAQPGDLSYTYTGSQIGISTVAMDGTPKVLKLENITVPASIGTNTYLYDANSPDTSDFKVLAFWVVKGATAGDRPPQRQSKETRRQLAAADAGSRIIAMPPVLYGVQGREMNVFFDPLVFAGRGKFSWNIAHATTNDATYGRQQDERWTLTPGASALNTALTFTLADDAGEAALHSVSSSLKTALTASSAKTWRLLAIGDSNTAFGVLTSELLTLEAADANVSLSLVGTKGSGSNKHEGISGWTVARWYQPETENVAANPFSNAGAAFDFGFAMANGLSAFSTPTHVPIMLGTNDVFGKLTDADVATTAAENIVKLEAMIDSIQAYDANIKIGIALPMPPAFDQAAFGADYGIGQSRARFKRNILLYNRAIIAAFRDRESEKVYVLPTNVAVDAEHNFPRGSSAAWNSRSTELVARQNNGVHPDTGIKQVSDVYWAWMNVVG